MRYWFFLLLSFSAFAQEAGELTHDDLLRDYIIYIPDSYSSNEPVPLVINLHGYGSNATQQMIYSGFNAVADVHGFIVVCPNGTLDSVDSPFWNAQWEEDGVDDVGFLSALIDHLAGLYNLDLNRVYSTGMSNGGFMSYTLACSLGNRIAAIASVTGTMTHGQLEVCNPERPMPVMEIHGTADPTVPYEGDEDFIAGTDEVIEYWTTFNSCNQDPVLELLPDVNQEDGSTVEHYVYDCPSAPVELYKVLGGAHTWPGATFVFSGTNLDFVAQEKIWEFFAEHSLMLDDQNVDCPDLGLNFAAPCDDGDATTVNDSVTEFCVCEGVACPETPCDDGDCANGFESWDAATCDCASIPSVPGCTDVSGYNYNPDANCDDGSCESFPSGLSENPSSLAFQFYPNPTRDFLVVDLKDEGMTAIEVYDASGQLLDRIEGLNRSTIEIETSSWETGLYFLRVESPGNRMDSNDFQRILKIR